MHNIAGEHLVDEVNESVGTYRSLIDMSNYKNGSIQWALSGGVTMTIWATNSETADSTADTEWENVTTSITGNASEVDNSGIAFLDTNIRCLKLMVKRVTSDTSNASDVWISRGN